MDLPGTLTGSADETRHPASAHDGGSPHGDSPELRADVGLLGGLLGETIRAREGEVILALVEGLRHAAIRLRKGQLEGGRTELAERIARLDLDSLEQVARAFAQYFHLVNEAEEQQRIRALRQRDRPGAPPEGSIAAACAQLRREGATPADIRRLLGRLYVMPVLTAHPTEARRRTLLDHLADVAAALDRLDDPRPGARDRERVLLTLREAIEALHGTEEARASRPTPIDEVRAGLDIFERSLLEVTPILYRELEDSLAASYPEERFTVGTFLRWGTWIGGDRDGNPNITSEITRVALERQRRLVLTRHMRDADQLGRVLSVSERRSSGRAGQRGLDELVASLEADRRRMPEIAARARRYEGSEPWREKCWYIRARLDATRGHGDGAYPNAHAYLEEIELLSRTLGESGYQHLVAGHLRDVRRRAQVFGFHLASLDLRQHSAVHEAAVDEILARGGVEGYAKRDEAARVSLLTGLLERANLGVSRDRGQLSPSTRELLATLDVVGRARRDQGPEACERYVVSFTSSPSDLLEVLLLVRAAHLAPDELRPVPLLEQLSDLEGASKMAEAMLDLPPLAAALRGEMEVMVGYSDSSKQSGYVASQVALYQAQEALARVAEERGVTLTVFHGRGGAIGRGGGPESRAIRAQPPRALDGRLRVTEQGETIATRYGRREIACRDLEQMISGVLVASLAERRAESAQDVSRRATVTSAAAAARRAYEDLIADRDRLARYAVAATPILEVAELPIASRPSSRRPGLSFDDLRAIPWVFSWNQSRHGLPGWFGLGTALDEIAAHGGIEQARELYASWPFFRALVDNAELALVRGDIEVAACYAALADPDARQVFADISAEHQRTIERVLEVTGEQRLLEHFPTLALAVARRNPYVDVLSHAQIELLRRLRAAPPPDEIEGLDGSVRDRIREILFITINGIAAGLQTAG